MLRCCQIVQDHAHRYFHEKHEFPNENSSNICKLNCSQLLYENDF